ncbi:MAG TPA: hypothetical protein VK978_03435 [Candidatus Saccharimonadales bacterium]|nr:hypothetical protein [Candidatus Saccharimonadales bacterium]
MAENRNVAPYVTLGLIAGVAASWAGGKAVEASQNTHDALNWGTLVLEYYSRSGPDAVTLDLHAPDADPAASEPAFSVVCTVPGNVAFDELSYRVTVYEEETRVCDDKTIDVNELDILVSSLEKHLS